MPAVAWVASEEVFERKRVVEAQAFGLTQGLLDGIDAQDGCEVKERARDGRHWNPVAGRYLICG